MPVYINIHERVPFSHYTLLGFDSITINSSKTLTIDINLDQEHILGISSPLQLQYARFVYLVIGVRSN